MSYNISMKVKQFMTKSVLTVTPHTSIIEAAQIMFEKNFDGLPVVSNNKTLLGIITQADLVAKGANIHLPTILKLMQELPMYKKDSSLIKPELTKILSMTVKDIMNKEPFTIKPEQTMTEAAKIFSDHHQVNPLAVVDSHHRLVGVLSRYDIIRLYTGNMGTAKTITHEKSADKKVDIFVKQFGKHFVLVSKFRTKFWLLTSIMFIVVGFAIAFFLILRFDPKYSAHPEPLATAQAHASMPSVNNS